jgi:hypothetical protein
VGDEEFRVEVELDDESHGYSFGELLRSLDLDHEVRKRLGRNVVVTRDGSRLFVYTETEEQARTAEQVVRKLLASHNLTGNVSVSRWHPVEEEWLDASAPLPRTEEERDAEYERREAAEADEVDREGEFDWHVVAHLPNRDEATELAERLAGRGQAVARRWRYVVVGAVTRELAEELAGEIRREAPPEAEITVEVNPSEYHGPPLFVL